MVLTGFADEAGSDIEAQIRATQELGWEHIEARKIAVAGGEPNIHDISDADFDRVCAALDQAGVNVNCFGSAIANWGKQITDPNEPSLEETERAIPRMQRLGAKLVRVMSYAVLKDREPDDQMEEERFRRLREIVKRFTDAGMQPVHENCQNYGGMGWPYTLNLLENVPGLKLVFDTGNPVFTDDYSKPEPRPKQDPWEFYTHVKDHIAYVHIKDRILDPANPPGTHHYPGEGRANVREIVKDLLDGGYDGGFSMEPHMAVVHHDPSVTSSAQAMFDTYVEYGRRFMKLIEEIGHKDKLAQIKARE